MNYKKRALMMVIPVAVYFLLIAYKANVCYYDTVSFVKKMTPTGVTVIEKGESAFYCIFEAVTDLTGYFHFPKGINMKVIFPVFIIGVLVGLGVYLYTYFYWKQREENREGHEHGSAHFMNENELIQYQKSHMEK